MKQLMRSSRRRCGAAAAALVAAVGLTACGVERVDVSLDPGIPAVPGWVSACTTELVRSGVGPCIDEIVERVEAEANSLVQDGLATHAAFVAAYQPIADLLGTVTGSNVKVSVDNPLDPAATTPLTTTWTVGGEPVPVYACFEGPAVTVDTAPCAG